MTPRPAPLAARSAPGPLRRLVHAALAPVRKGWRFALGGLATLHAAGRWLGLGPARWRPRAYAELKAATFTNPYAFRAYDLLASQAAAVPVLAYRERGADDDLEELPDHPFLRLLRRPAPNTSWRSFLVEALDHLMFGGELFLYAPDSPVTGRAAGKPDDPAEGGAGLRLIRPDRVLEVVRDDDDAVTGYRVRGRRGRERTIPAGRVRHFVFYADPDDGERGWPLAAAAARAMETIAEGEDWQKALAQGKGRMPGFVKYTGEVALQDENLRNVAAEIKAQYAEDVEDGTPGVLDSDWDWISNAVGTREADLVLTEQQAARKVAIALGVMTPLLGDAQNMTYDNLRTAVRALLTLRVLPLLDWLLGELSAHYMGMYEAEGSASPAYLGYDADAIDALAEEQDAKYERMGRAVASGLATPNEGRGQLGWEAVPDAAADALYLPATLVPMAELGDPLAGASGDSAGAGDGVADLDALALRLTRPKDR